MRTILFLPLLLVCALAVGACGADTAPDRTDVNKVYERIMRAVHAADLDAVNKELTKNARFQLEKELKLLARRLGHPDDGEATRRAARDRLGERAEAAIEDGANGGVAGALRFYLLMDPRDPVPPRKSFKLDQFKCQIEYQLPTGIRRAVHFVREPSGWYVSQLLL